jgi:hypothetical protein
VQFKYLNPPFAEVPEDKNLAPIIEKAIEQAIAGDTGARIWLFERGYGRVAQTVVTEDEDGNSIPLQTINITPIDERSNS